MKQWQQHCCSSHAVLPAACTASPRTMLTIAQHVTGVMLTLANTSGSLQAIMLQLSVNSEN
jgi:hypothetical protein